MTIGEKIRILRESKNISQTELADKINTTKQSVYKYETGIVTNIPSDKIEKLAKILNTTPAYLMGWSDKNNDVSMSTFKEESEEITFDDFSYAMYNEKDKLTEEDKTALINMAKMLAEKNKNMR